MNKKEVEAALAEAYEKAGSNAYFDNGFRAGVEFSENNISKETQKRIEREKRCPTMMEAEARALLKALQEIAEIVGLDTAASSTSPAQIVETVQKLRDRS